MLLHVFLLCSVLIIATFLQSLGADECVDYKKDRFEDLYASDPFDVVLDLVGGELSLAVVELVSTPTSVLTRCL